MTQGLGVGLAGRGGHGHFLVTPLVDPLEGRRGPALPLIPGEPGRDALGGLGQASVDGQRRELRGRPLVVDPLEEVGGGGGRVEVRQRLAEVGGPVGLAILALDPGEADLAEVAQDVLLVGRAVHPALHHRGDVAVALGDVLAGRKVVVARPDDPLAGGGAVAAFVAHHLAFGHVPGVGPGGLLQPGLGLERREPLPGPLGVMGLDEPGDHRVGPGRVRVLRGRVLGPEAGGDRSRGGPRSEPAGRRRWGVSWPNCGDRSPAFQGPGLAEAPPRD